MGCKVKMLLGIMAVFISVAAAYSNSFYGVFVYDDFINILNNPAIRRFPSVISDTTRPLTNVTFYLQYRIGMVSAADFHLINLVLHLLNAGLVWTFLWVIGGIGGVRLRIMFATLGSLIWALHPVQTESVTYIVQRAELLSSVFLFAAVLSGLAYLAGRGRWWSVGLVLLLLIAAYAGKPTAVCGPLILLVLDAFICSKGFRRALVDHWKFHACSFATLTLPLFLLTGAHESTTSAGFSMQFISPLEYVAFQPRAILLYLFKYIWPRRLLIDYGYDVEHSWGVVALFLAVLLIMTYAGWRYGGIMRLGMCLFYAAMMPVIFVPLADLFAEHRLYVPSTGLAMLAAYGIAYGVKKLEGAGRAGNVRLCALATVGVICLLGFWTWLRNSDYSDAGRLWRQVVEERPGNIRGYLGLGAELAREGRMSEAEDLFRLGVDVYDQLDSRFLRESFRTDYGYLCFNMAVLLKARGKDRESLIFEEEANRQVMEFK